MATYKVVYKKNTGTPSIPEIDKVVGIVEASDALKARDYLQEKCGMIELLDIAKLDDTEY